MSPSLLSSITPILAHSDEVAPSAGGLIFGGTLLLFMLLFFIAGIALFVFWILMVIDAFRRTNWPNNDQRTLWLILLCASLFFQIFWVVAAIYYFAIKKPLDSGEAPTFFENQKAAAPSQPHPKKKSTTKK